MAVLTIRGLAKYWGVDLLFKNIDFMLNQGEKLALVGRNGTGKTTLMQILMGKMEHDEGSIIKSNGLRLGYLSQDPDFIAHHTLLEEAQTAFAHLQLLEQEIRSLEEQMGQVEGSKLETLMGRYGDLTAQFEAAGGYDAQARVLTVLYGLGFKEGDLQKPVRILSGGQKVRLGLAKILLEEPDLMLLDEPTNHLDLEATEWLESYFKNMKSAAILVSHDRYFLDKVITKVYELDNNSGSTYHGNYGYYVEEKQRHIEAAVEAYERQREEAAKLEAFYLKWRLTPSRKNQAMSRKKQLEKMKFNEKPKTYHKDMKLRWKMAQQTGDDVLKVTELSKQYDDKVLFAKVNLELYKSDKVALVGPNGVGKSTFLKIVQQLLTPTSGSFTWGTGVKMGYFSQDLDDLDYGRTCLEEIMELPKFTKFDAYSLLGRFLFSGEDVEKMIGNCSGGERNRLILAKLVVSGANVLLLDEPTNHLDLAAKEVLQDALEAFEGTILFVSHDRYFVDQVATKVWEFSHDGVTEYEGNYSAYKEEKARLEQLKAQAQVLEVKKLIDKGREKATQEARERKEERLRIQELADIEQRIGELEDQKLQLEGQLAEESAYKDDGGRELVTAYREVQDELSRLYGEWETRVS